ncbi:hypothetical protein [Rhodococcus aetherivorans]|uniref:hypothetical protein n=1 Tax=Rhodococcus aetherivorans TaxID=191292 RepID=UPI00388F4644
MSKPKTVDEILDYIENYGVSSSSDGFDKTPCRIEAKRQILALIYKERLALLDHLDARVQMLPYSNAVRDVRSILRAEKEKL